MMARLLTGSTAKKKQPDRSVRNACEVLRSAHEVWIRASTSAGRDAGAVASRWNLEIVFLEPNLEGLLLRLHPGSERRQIAPGETMAELRKVWPEYRKPPRAADLGQRFDLPALRRAARHDRELERLLAVLGL